MRKALMALPVGGEEEVLRLRRFQRVPAGVNILQEGHTDYHKISKSWEAFPPPSRPLEEIVWRRQGETYVSDWAPPLSLKQVEELRVLLSESCDQQSMLERSGVSPARMQTFLSGLRHLLGTAPEPADLRTRLIDLFTRQQLPFGNVEFLAVEFHSPQFSATAEAGFGQEMRLLMPWKITSLGRTQQSFAPCLARTLSQLSGGLWLGSTSADEDWENLWLARCHGLVGPILTRLQGEPAARERLRYSVGRLSGSHLEVLLNLSSGTVDASTWTLEFRQGLPTADWNACLQELDTMELAVRRQPWLEEWKRERFGRTIAAQPVEDDHWTLLLREADERYEVRAQVKLSRDGSTCQITNADPRPGASGHWLDKLEVTAGKPVEVVGGRPK